MIVVRCDTTMPHLKKKHSHIENQKRREKNQHQKQSTFSVNNESIPCVIFFSFCDEMLLFKIYYRKKTEAAAESTTVKTYLLESLNFSQAHKYMLFHKVKARFNIVNDEMHSVIELMVVYSV